MSLTAAFGAIALGLAGTPHCVGMCGPFAAATGDLPELAAWNVGRLVSYATLGAVAGAFGAVIPGPVWVGPVVAGLLITWSAASIVGWTRPLHLALPGVRNLARGGNRTGLVAKATLGVASGLLPCGLVHAAMALAVAAGTPLAGALAMLAFGLGTTPGPSAAAFGLRRVLDRTGRWGRFALAAAVLVTGLGAVATRWPAADGKPTCHDEMP